MTPLTRSAPLVALVLIAGCTTSTAPDDPDQVTGTILYSPGYSWGPPLTVRMTLDGETATLTTEGESFPSAMQQRPQDHDAEMVDYLRSVDALDGRDSEKPIDSCQDGDSGSLQLTIDDVTVEEGFDCRQPGVTSTAITRAGFDLEGLLDELYREHVAAS